MFKIEKHLVFVVYTGIYTSIIIDFNTQFYNNLT